MAVFGSANIAECCRTNLNRRNVSVASQLYLLPDGLIAGRSRSVTNRARLPHSKNSYALRLLRSVGCRVLPALAAEEYAQPDDHRAGRSVLRLFALSSGIGEGSFPDLWPVASYRFCSAHAFSPSMLSYLVVRVKRSG